MKAKVYKAIFILAFLQQIPNIDDKKIFVFSIYFYFCERFYIFYFLKMQLKSNFYFAHKTIKLPKVSLINITKRIELMWKDKMLRFLELDCYCCYLMLFDFHLWTFDNCLLPQLFPIF